MNDPIPNTPAEALTQAVLLIFQANGALIRFGDQFVASDGLTSASWQVLGGIALAGGHVTTPQIARNMGQARQSVQRQVNALKTRGLVATHANPNNRRSPHLVLTDEGQGVYDQVATRWLAWAALAAQGLHADEVASAVRLMTTLISATQED